MLAMLSKHWSILIQKKIAIDQNDSVGSLYFKKLFPLGIDAIVEAINQIIEDLDQGKKRVAEKINGNWTTHQYIKKAVMLSFRIHEMGSILVQVTFRKSNKYIKLLYTFWRRIYARFEKYRLHIFLKRRIYEMIYIFTKNTAMSYR